MEARIASSLALVAIACTARDPSQPTRMTQSAVSRSTTMAPILGPVIATRAHGEPATAVYEFRNCEPLAQYRLRIENGAGGTLEHVTSGRVLLNGSEVLGPRDLKNNVDVVERGITATTDNQLAITLEGKPG